MPYAHPDLLFFLIFCILKIKKEPTILHLFSQNFLAESSVELNAASISQFPATEPIWETLCLQDVNRAAVYLQLLLPSHSE